MAVAVLRNLWKINDDMKVVYYLIMVLAIFAPVWFFAAKTEYMAYVTALYGLVALLLRPNVKRQDISNNWRKYFFWILGAVIFVSVTYAGSPQQGQIQFVNIFTMMIFLVFVVGYSESLIRQGLLQRTGNPFLTNAVMGMAHANSYMALTGSFVFSAHLVYMMFMAMLGFWLFQIIQQRTDTFVEALVHGVYNAMFY